MLKDRWILVQGDVWSDPVGGELLFQLAWNLVKARFVNARSSVEERKRWEWGK